MKSSKQNQRITELEKERDRLSGELQSKNERMEVLRQLNKKLEAKSVDILKKCEKQSSSIDYCIKMETKCE